MAAQKKLITKGQIVTHFADKFDISKKAAASIIDEYAVLAIAETKKKGAFVLPGIGRSVLVKRKARIGRNPATGEAISIPAKTVVKMSDKLGGGLIPAPLFCIFPGLTLLSNQINRL